MPHTLPTASEITSILWNGAGSGTSVQVRLADAIMEAAAGAEPSKITSVDQDAAKSALAETVSGSQSEPGDVSTSR